MHPGRLGNVLETSRPGALSLRHRSHPNEGGPFALTFAYMGIDPDVVAEARRLIEAANADGCTVR